MKKPSKAKPERVEEEPAEATEKPPEKKAASGKKGVKGAKAASAKGKGKTKFVSERQNLAPTI